MDVFRNCRSLNESVVCENVLLACLACLSLNLFLYSVTVSHLAGFQALDICRGVCDSSVSDSLGKSLEALCASDKVGFATKGDEYCLAVCDA